MKKTIPAVFLFSILAVSCNKSDDDNGPAPVKPPVTVKHNTWKLGATSYKVGNYASNASDDFQVYDTAYNGLNFSFATYPPADGNYTIIDRSASLGPNQMKVVAFGPISGSSYFASGSDHTVATVKVLGATRIQINLPDTWVVKGTDSMKLSVDIGDL